MLPVCKNVAQHMQLIVTRPASHSAKREGFNEAETGVHLEKRVRKEGRIWYEKAIRLRGKFIVLK